MRNVKIIGHGTWYDKEASNIIKREKKLGRSLELIKTEMGLGASGLPHIGNLGDAVRSFAVALAVREQGFKSELIAFSDDVDGLRSIPAGFSDSLQEYIGFPVIAIPDPFDCHRSYAQHMSSLLLESLDRCGIEYKYISGKEAYDKGLLDDEIRTILLNAKRVGEIVREEVGQERYMEVLPYFPICSNCGRIYTTKATEFLPSENKILYDCAGMEIRGHWIEGCGYKGEADIRNRMGKLSWKGEFAARWKSLDIRFEPYGKDLEDSVRINDRICREILKYEPPLHARYEMFLDKSGRKISSSTGNVLTPQLWFKYGSPQSLILLMLKRFVGARTLDITDIPPYMDELDELEEVYFGKKKVRDEKKLTKLRGLYKYCWMLHPPNRSTIHIQYELLASLARVAPKEREKEFIIGKLKNYKLLEEDKRSYEGFDERIEYVYNWIEDFKETKKTSVTLSFQEKKAIKELCEALRIENDADSIQSTIFEIARKNGVGTKRFFNLIYSILLGTPSGPRLGPYLIDLGANNTIRTLEKAIKPNLI